MYADRDFGEMCLLTNLADLPCEYAVELKAVVSETMRTRSMSTLQRAQSDEYSHFLDNVPLLCVFDCVTRTQTRERTARAVPAVGP